MHRIRIVVAPCGFKEALDAETVAAAIAAGLRRASDQLDIIEFPLVDGGEGFARTLVRVTGGELHRLRVTGPLGEPVDSHWGMLGPKVSVADGPTAVIEMAAAAGLRLVPRDRRNPAATTTFGVGELVRAALDGGARRLLIGCGDSGTSDGGAGMAQALGIRLLDKSGADIPFGATGLLDLERIDISGRDRRIDDVRIDVACNMRNLLCGPYGVARIYGPQKGASAATVASLEDALERYAAVLARDVSQSDGDDPRVMPGGGASGGLGTALRSLLGARLHHSLGLVTRYLDLEEALRTADLVITAEGGIDAQTPRGKVPVEVAQRAKRHGVPVIALAGTISSDARVVHDHGIDALFSTVPGPCTLDEAMVRTSEQIEQCAENVMRAILVSITIGRTRRFSAGQGASRRPEAA